MSPQPDGDLGNVFGPQTHDEIEQILEPKRGSE